MSRAEGNKKAPKWDRHPDAWYVEERWCADRLFEDEVFPGRTVDPCAGGGNIVKAGRDMGLQIEGFDLRNRAPGLIRGGLDFFDPHAYTPGIWPADNIVTNPPYATWSQVGREPPKGAFARVEDEFVARALERVRCKLAVFLPSVWMNGQERSRWLESLPLYRVYICTPRPSCPPGTYLEAGGKPKDGQTDYNWYVFLRGYQGRPEVRWLRRDD